MKVTWFRHADEHRNDLLRFGLMRLHTFGRISYVEENLAKLYDAKPTLRQDSPPHHLSLIQVSCGGSDKLCAVDSEDSFYWMSPLVEQVDLYFCSGYSSSFFRGLEFPKPYNWQSQTDIEFYRRRAIELISRYSQSFPRVRPFIPIGPNLGWVEETSFFTRKLRNLRHRLETSFSDSFNWRTDFKAYEKRYTHLLRLRESALEYDVVLNDSLWGWPGHRIRLHRQLQSLSNHHRIHAKLSWAPPVTFDGSNRLNLREEDFPLEVNKIADYEHMLSASRLGVFATGFHWGWRNIMTLAMFFGLPILTDRPILEPWFDLCEFDLIFNETDDWSQIGTVLSSIGSTEWTERRHRNQAIYDEYLSPEAVAAYFLTATGQDQRE